MRCVLHPEQTWLKEGLVQREISGEELARLIAKGTNQNTCKATATWLITVTAYRNEEKLDISFATCSAEKL